MKFCKKCGRMLTDDAEFCPSCGTAVGEEVAEEAKQVVQEFHEVDPAEVAPKPVEEVKPVPVVVPAEEAAPVVKAEEPVSEEQNSAANRCMVFGIIAAALSTMGLPGLILSLIARRKINDYEAKYGTATRKAKAGKICTRVAFPVSIGFTVFWTIYFLVLFIIMIVAITSALSNGGANIQFN